MILFLKENCTWKLTEVSIVARGVHEISAMDFSLPTAD